MDKSDSEHRDVGTKQKVYVHEKCEETLTWPTDAEALLRSGSSAPFFFSPGSRAVVGEGHSLQDSILIRAARLARQRMDPAFRMTVAPSFDGPMTAS